MPLELKYKRHVFALLMMFVPYGIAMPTLARAASLGRAGDVVTLDSLYTDGYIPTLHAGGTIVLPEATVYMIPRAPFGRWPVV